MDKTHWEKYIQEIRDAEERAASVMVDFARSNRNTPTEAETHYVQYCFGIAGCNDELTRRIEAQCILRNCITRTDRAELSRIETALRSIVKTENSLNYGRISTEQGR